MTFSANRFARVANSEEEDAMKCYSCNTSEPLTIWNLVQLLSKGRLVSAFEILLDIDGSSRACRQSFHCPDARNAATELLLLNRRADSNLLIELAAQCPHDVVSVLLSSAQKSESVALSPRTRLSMFEFPRSGNSKYAFSPLAEHLCGQVLKEDLSGFSRAHYDSESSVHSPSAHSSEIVNARTAKSYVNTVPTYPLSRNALTSNFTEQGERTLYRLSHRVLEMCVSGTQALKNLYEAHPDDILDRWVHSHDYGELHSIMNQSMAHGDVYCKLVDIVDKTDVKDGIMAVIVYHITSILHDYVKSLTTVANHIRPNECFVTLNRSEECAEQMMHLLAIFNEASPLDTRSVIRKILARPNRYYDSHAVNAMASTVLATCFHELNLAIMRPPPPPTDNACSLFSGTYWHDGVNSDDAAIVSSAILSDFLDSSALSAFQRVSFSRALLSHFGEEDKSWTLLQDCESTKRKGKIGFFDEEVGEEPLSNTVFQISVKDTGRISSASASTSDNCKENGVYLYLDPDLHTRPKLETLSKSSSQATAESQTLSLKRKIAEYEDLDENFQARLLYLFAAKLKVYEHLNNLFSFALLGAGNFADALISQLDVAFAQCEKNEKFLSMRSKASLTFVSAADPIGKLRRIDLYLQKSLRTALNFSLAQDRVGAEMGLSSDVQHNGSQNLWGDRIHFHYKVDYPLDVVITNSCTQAYSLLFDFFLKLRRATNGIHSLFVLTRRVSNVRSRTINHTSMQKTRTLLWYFCWEAQHFLYEVREKTMRIVLERFSNYKEDLWADVDTVWELKRRLEHLLHWSLDTCFLSHEHQSLLGVLTVGFQIIISIEGKLHKSHISSRSSHDVEDMLRSATFSLKRRMHFFQDMLHRLGPGFHSLGK